MTSLLVSMVALRKESVDRNIILAEQLDRPTPSLSARRAWIEIAYGALEGASEMSLSARRAWIEIFHNGLRLLLVLSLSARRAWIEIIKKGRARRPGQVALRKESVDRNPGTNIILSITALGRSPQGERG